MTKRLTDDVLNAGVDKSGVIPEFVEWYDAGDLAVMVRIEPHMGRYVEQPFYPWMTEDDVADKLRRMSEELDGRG